MLPAWSRASSLDMLRLFAVAKPAGADGLVFESSLRLDFGRSGSRIARFGEAPGTFGELASVLSLLLRVGQGHLDFFRMVRDLEQ